ncbi:hypothetical protein DFH08DRAFT_1084231 [Mycena albidolilacea]|uniref:Uncharacterized protein n=1 Tax=Mycena albidolilacea TaxID=1033008 RepID=A0AAD6ZMS3_9AGAR|nr:hypothetical protein DFH08DRAFT_1084231 [Mycena albidolilacea]
MPPGSLAPLPPPQPKLTAKAKKGPGPPRRTPLTRPLAIFASQFTPSMLVERRQNLLFIGRRL